ncbi:MAG: hypothetical protein WBA74_08275 [Cyclobacteriaceae bacterium]
MNDQSNRDKIEIFYQRIKDQRVSAAYHSQALYSAATRLKKQNRFTINYFRWLKIIAMTTSLFGFSGLSAILLGADYPYLIPAAVFLGFITLLAEFLQTIKKDPKDWMSYQKQGEAFNLFYKYIKSEEACIEAGTYNGDWKKVLEIMKNIDERYEDLYDNPLPVEGSDYEQAGKNIKNGNLKCTEEDYKNT